MDLQVTYAWGNPEDVIESIVKNNSKTIIKIGECFQNATFFIYISRNSTFILFLQKCYRFWLCDLNWLNILLDFNDLEFHFMRILLEWMKI